MFILIFIFTFIFIFIYYISLHIYIYIYVYLSLSLSICIYIYIYIYTHIFAYAQSPYSDYPVPLRGESAQNKGAPQKLSPRRSQHKKEIIIEQILSIVPSMEEKW